MDYGRRGRPSELSLSLVASAVQEFILNPLAEAYFISGLFQRSAWIRFWKELRASTFIRHEAPTVCRVRAVWEGPMCGTISSLCPLGTRNSSWLGPCPILAYLPKPELSDIWKMDEFADWMPENQKHSTAFDDALVPCCWFSELRRASLYFGMRSKSWHFPHSDTALNLGWIWTQNGIQKNSIDVHWLLVWDFAVSLLSLPDCLQGFLWICEPKSVSGSRNQGTSDIQAITIWACYWGRHDRPWAGAWSWTNYTSAFD